MIVNRADDVYADGRVTEEKRHVLGNKGDQEVLGIVAMLDVCLEVLPHFLLLHGSLHKNKLAQEDTADLSHTDEFNHFMLLMQSAICIIFKRKCHRSWAHPNTCTRLRFRIVHGRQHDPLHLQRFVCAFTAAKSAADAQLLSTDNGIIVSVTLDRIPTATALHKDKNSNM
jgi:hypothetical protein